MSLSKKFRLLTFVFLIFSLSVPAYASPLTAGTIVSFSDVTVPAGEQVKSILVIGGNAHIAGHVMDEVVVINGNALLASTAKIRDHVIVLGGHIAAENGAWAGKGYFQYGGDYFAISSLLTAGLMVAIIWFVQFIVTMALLVVPLVTVWLRPNWVGELTLIMKDHKMKAFCLGILGIIAGLVMIAIFSLSIIGIPLALLLLLLLAAIIALGVGAVCAGIGDTIATYTKGIAHKKYFSVLLGSLFFALLFNIPFIGLVALCLAAAVGLGAVLLKFFVKKLTANNG